MTKRSANKYILSISFFWVFTLNALCSHWFQEVISFPLFLARIITICIYLPFFVAIVIKILCDYSDHLFLEENNKFYYAFLLYYSIETMFRLLTHAEYKESVYLLVVFFGSAAFIIEQNKKNYFSKDDIIYSFFFFELILIIARILYYLFGIHMFEFPLINTNIVSGALLASLPFNLFYLTLREKRKQWLNEILILLSLTVILVSGSRACFFLLLFIILICGTFFIIKDKNNFIRLCAIIFASVLFVFILVVFNFEDVRSNVFREAWFLNGLSKKTDDTMIINAQITRSDAGRKELLLFGIHEIKKNPFFGTGNVLYQQKIMENYTANQSAHNFIIEALVSVGLIGTVLLLSLIWRMVSTVLKRQRNYIIIFFLLSIGSYTAFALVQPVFFNTIVGFVFAVVICCYTSFSEI